MEQSLSGMPAVNASKFRKKKETVYFILVLLVSAIVWGASVWGLYYGINQLVQKPKLDASKLCYGKSQTDESLFVVPDEYKAIYLENGEKCADYSALDPVERAKALKEFEASADKTRQEDAGGSIVIICILLIILFVGFLMNLYALAFIRMTGVRVGPNQYTDVWESAQQLAARLGLKKTPDIFILNGDGILNAFAAKLISRKLIVLYSDLAETLTESENRSQLDAVLAHELGHHALGHTKLYLWLLYPGECIPFISFAWSREREYSADRVMQALISESDTYERGLIKLAAGKLFGQRANIDEYVAQITYERGFMIRWAEYFSTHPFLPKRIRELRRYKESFDGIEKKK